MTPTNHTAAGFAVSRLKPGDLATLSDEQFRRVVDADLRRRQPKTQEDRIPDAVVRALRTDYLDRWHQELSRIIASVESQLEGREHDYEREMAVLRRRALAEGEATVRAAMEDLTIRHHEAQGRTTRFASSAREALVEATELRDRKNRAAQSSVLAQERNHYAERAARLEGGIRIHRQAVLADLDDGEVVDPIDTQLWALLEEAS